MCFLKKQFLLLAHILGLTTGINLLPLAQITAQAAETLDNQSSPQNGVIQACTGSVIELGSPQLTNEELKALTNCSSETIPQLLTALESQDWEVKVVAAYTLGLSGIRAYSAIPALSNLVQNGNADVRFVAAQALGEIGIEAVVPALTEALQDPDENVRVSAIVAFQNIGLAASQAKAELLAALWDGNWFVKNGAATTISKLSLDTSDIPSIINPLRDNFINTVRSPDDFYTQNTQAIVSLMLSIYPPIFNKLEDLPLFFIEGLESEDPEVREASAIALAQISLSGPGHERLNESIHALKKVVEDRDSKVRASALKALGQITAERFDWKEYHEDAQIRDNIESLLLKSLEDPDPNVRQVALQYFATGRYSRSARAKRRPSVIFSALKAIQDEDPAIRQNAVNVLDNNLDKLDSIPSVFKPQLSERVFLALTNALYDKDANVRQNAWNSLHGERRISALIEILQQENIDSNVRYDAFSTIATYGEIVEKSQVIVELLEEALEDFDPGIRVNAASALESAEKMSTQAGVSIFIEGLKSENPLAKLHAVFALHKMCSRRSVRAYDPSRCAETKSALPFLINTLEVNIKPLQYAAALAIADIDSEEERGIPILETILLKETDRGLREKTISALGTIDSPNARSAMTYVTLEDKQARYMRSCLIEPYVPLFYWESKFYWNNKFESTELMLQTLENPDLRTSASHSFDLFLLNDRSFDQEENSHLKRKLRFFHDIQFLVSELTSILNNHRSTYAEHPVMHNIFKLKGKDLRRSATYSLGTIATSLLRRDAINYYYNGNNFSNSEQFDRYPQVWKEIIETLTRVAADQEENLEVRWMAAAQLQANNIPVDDFFIRENMINPAIALAQSRWVGAMEILEFRPGIDFSYFIQNDLARPVDPSSLILQDDFLLNQYGFIPGLRGIPGLDFDIYSKQYIYDTRLGCGAGLGEIFNTLQRLFNRTSE